MREGESEGAMYEYRVVCFHKPRGPWRREKDQARRDAITLKLGTYDEWGRYYDIVPGAIEWRIVVAARTAA